MTIPYLPATGKPSILRNDFLIATVIGLVFSGLTFALAYSVGWMSGAPNWFEVAGATINYGATYLSIKQRRLAYTLGFVASGVFAIAYFQYGLLGSSILSLYLVGQLVYGYFRWGPDGNPRPVHHFELQWAWAYVLATAVTYIGAALIVQAFGGSFAFWDAAILVLTILSQFLLDNKVLESWYVWVLVNIIGVTLYFTAGAYFAAFQQLIFLFANVYGFISWRKTMLAGDAGRGLGKGRAAKEALVRGDDGIKRLVMTDEITAREGKNYSFKPGSKLYITTGQKPIIREDESPSWRRIKPTQYSGDSKVEATYYDPKVDNEDKDK